MKKKKPPSYGVSSGPTTRPCTSVAFCSSRATNMPGSGVRMTALRSVMRRFMHSRVGAPCSFSLGCQLSRCDDAAAAAVAAAGRRRAARSVDEWAVRERLVPLQQSREPLHEVVLCGVMAGRVHCL
eukprot:TRINITY_DN4205_c0_g2_i1.p2 TRINITY_DN4205_c0_g2~~TRINITY_DN4205_c0_g2_i1.p2  ORF type:complete len:126 (-),score=14.84 TRINITY_DN4205_c0_g2_i1:395-772(-)